jgi:hypothetical protein
LEETHHREEGGVELPSPGKKPAPLKNPRREAQTRERERERERERTVYITIDL